MHRHGYIPDTRHPYPDAIWPPGRGTHPSDIYDCLSELLSTLGEGRIALGANASVHRLELTHEELTGLYRFAADVLKGWIHAPGPVRRCLLELTQTGGDQQIGLDALRRMLVYQARDTFGVDLEPVLPEHVPDERHRNAARGR